MADDAVQPMVTWPAPQHPESRKSGMAVLFPIPDSDLANDAKLLILLGTDLDVTEPLRDLATHLVDLTYASTTNTAATWVNAGGGRTRDDLLVATARGATGYRNIHLWTRKTDDHMVEVLTDGSRYLPYFGDTDDDGVVELFLSTVDNHVDAAANVVPTTYRVLVRTDGGGFRESHRIASDELPLDRLSPLVPNARRRTADSRAVANRELDRLPAHHR